MQILIQNATELKMFFKKVCDGEIFEPFSSLSIFWHFMPKTILSHKAYFASLPKNSHQYYTRFFKSLGIFYPGKNRKTNYPPPLKKSNFAILTGELFRFALALVLTLHSQ